MATETTNLHTENNYIRKFTGVDRFHNAGYFGERVTAATGENWSIKTMIRMIWSLSRLGMGTAGVISREGMAARQRQHSFRLRQRHG